MTKKELYTLVKHAVREVVQDELNDTILELKRLRKEVRELKVGGTVISEQNGRHITPEVGQAGVPLPPGTAAVNRMAEVLERSFKNRPQPSAPQARQEQPQASKGIRNAAIADILKQTALERSGMAPDPMQGVHSAYAQLADGAAGPSAPSPHMMHMHEEYRPQAPQQEYIPEDYDPSGESIAYSNMPPPPGR